MTATRAFLQTRGTGRAGDYTFLGSAPEEPWWRAYRDVTAFDHPTVLVASDGARWAAYLSGIPSARVDAVGTVVRYTVVLDGPCDATDTGCVVPGVAAWLDDIAAGPAGSRGRLSAALDGVFPAHVVEHMITRPPGGGTGPVVTDDPGPAPGSPPDAAAVRSLVERALVTLPVPPPEPDVPGSWVAGVGSAHARAAFVARVGELVGGTPGRALLLNLVGGPDDAAAVLDATSPVAVLVDGAAPDRPTPLHGEVDAKKAPTPRPRRAGAATAAVGGLVVLAVLAVLAVLVLLL